MGTVKGVIVGISFVTITVTVSLSLEMRLKGKGKGSKDHSNGFNKNIVKLREREGQRVDLGRSLKGDLYRVFFFFGFSQGAVNQLF